VVEFFGRQLGESVSVFPNVVRSVLEKSGYVLWKREFLVYGIDSWLDISRLSRAWQTKVQIFFDVGANIGQTAEVALKAFPEAHVFSFEPHSATFQRLIALPAQRLSGYPLAFSDHEGEAKFYEYASEGEGTQINSLVPDARFPTQFGYPAKEGVAQCSTVDRFCEENAIKRIDVLKIDTEGSELLVLKGAEQMLRAGRVTFILTEYNELLPKSGTTGGSLLPIAEYLSSFGYAYITSYTDRVMEKDMFVSANALFANRPTRYSRHE
jgi:FkbM family methyltransferase